MIYAIEGPVAAGKTTLLTTLKKQNFPVIAEYTDFAHQNNLALPKFPPININQAKSNLNFYFDIELERRRIFNLQKTTNHIFLDRSIFSLLAFEKAATTITNIDIFEWAANKINDNRNSIIWPKKIFYLDLPSKICRERITQANMHTPEFFTESNFHTNFRNFFIEMKNKDPDYVEFIDAQIPKENLAPELLKRVAN